MKLLMEPIDVATGKPSTSSAPPVSPTAFCWRGRLYEVETVLEEWSARGDWWGKEERRTYYLLMTTNGVLEIFRGREGWMLSRIYD